MSTIFRRLALKEPQSVIDLLTRGATQCSLVFPAIGAISILMVSGWHDVLPERYKQKLPLLVITLMVMFTIALWVFGIPQILNRK
jgi:hypothetical protein